MILNSRKPSNLDHRDPKNLLSAKARVRIEDAMLQQQHTRLEAEARSQFLDANSAAAEMSSARMKAAFQPLQVIVQEFMAAGITGKELWEIVEAELEGAETSIELTGLEKKAVRAQLWTVPPSVSAYNKSETGQGGELHTLTSIKHKPLSPPRTGRGSRSVGNKHAVERLKVHLNTKGLGLTDFATDCGITDRTLRRLLADTKTSRSTLNAIAKKMGLTIEALLADQ